MSTRAELEAVIAQAEAEWLKANDEIGKAQAVRATANANWDRVITAQRKVDSDRRTANGDWDKALPDQRKSDADRRTPDFDPVAFSKIVADRHKAYADWVNAEADWTQASADLITATRKRKNAIAVLDELDRAQIEPLALAPPLPGRWLMLRKGLSILKPVQKSPPKPRK
jgi:hypothetical protein